MSDNNSSSNTSYAKLLPMLKDSYASKLKKITEKPNSSKQYFSFLKKKLKRK